MPLSSLDGDQAICDCFVISEANRPTKVAFYFLLIFLAADHCAIGNPCKNGGTCLNGEKNFECHCLPGFYGVDCGGMCYAILY